MRLVSYPSPTGPRAAVVNRKGRYVDLNSADPKLPAGMCKFLTLGPEALARAADIAETGKTIDRAAVKLLPPVPRPEKILCIGLNYADHARETGKEPPPEPVVFSKFVTALIADGDAIVLPRLSQKVDYEAELVVVIGRRREAHCEGAGAGICRRVCLWARCFGAGLATAEAGRTVAAGEIVRHVCPAGAGAGDGG